MIVGWLLSETDCVSIWLSFFRVELKGVSFIVYMFLRLKRSDVLLGAVGGWSSSIYILFIVDWLALHFLWGFEALGDNRVVERQSVQVLQWCISYISKLGCYLWCLISIYRISRIAIGIWCCIKFNRSEYLGSWSWLLSVLIQGLGLVADLGSINSITMSQTILSYDVLDFEIGLTCLFESCVLTSIVWSLVFN